MFKERDVELQKLESLAYAQAREILLKPEVFKGRREVFGVTIDPPFAFDFDDAVWVETRDGVQRAYISIPDVSALILKGSPIDILAKKKAFSRYFGTTSVDPMLPLNLSTYLLSLVSGERRPSITVSLSLSGEVQIFRSFLTVKSSFNYYTAHEGIVRRRDKNHLLFTKLFSFAQKLFYKRLERGSLAYFDPEKFILTNEEGHPQKMPYGLLSHLIIQEFMIAANSAISGFFVENNIPVIFRNHAKQDGLSGVAFYSLEPRGHFGLARDSYVHATAPIRRYVDLVNGRQLSAFLGGQNLPYNFSSLEGVLGDVDLAYKAGLEAKKESKKNSVEVEKAVLKAIADAHLGMFHFSQELPTVEERVINFKGLLRDFCKENRLFFPVFRTTFSTSLQGSGFLSTGSFDFFGQRITVQGDFAKVYSDAEQEAARRIIFEILGKKRIENVRGEGE